MKPHRRRFGERNDQPARESVKTIGVEFIVKRYYFCTHRRRSRHRPPPHTTSAVVANSCSAVVRDIDVCANNRRLSPRVHARCTHFSCQVCVYGSMVILMWGRPLIAFSPDYLWPSCFSHALSGGRAAGSVGAMSVVAMFVFGLAPRFSPTG